MRSTASRWCGGLPHRRGRPGLSGDDAVGGQRAAYPRPSSPPARWPVRDTAVAVWVRCGVVRIVGARMIHAVASAGDRSWLGAAGFPRWDVALDRHGARPARRGRRTERGDIDARRAGLLSPVSPGRQSCTKVEPRGSACARGCSGDPRAHGGRQLTTSNGDVTRSDVSDVVLGIILGCLIIGAMLAQSASRRNATVRRGLARLGDPTGKTEADFVKAIGRNPNTISEMLHGQRLLQWQAQGEHLAVLFTADHRYARITHRHQV